MSITAHVFATDRREIPAEPGSVISSYIDVVLHRARYHPESMRETDGGYSELLSEMDAGPDEVP